MATTGIVTPQSQATTQDAGKTKAVVPFVRAARRHREAFFDTTYTWTAGQTTQIGPVEVAPYGFSRGVFIEVTATGGNGSTTAAAAAADAPWNVLGTVSFNDVNGAPVYGPLDGYNMYLMQKYGGYFNNFDPRYGIYSAIASTGNFTVMFYVPNEVIARNALGDLPNTNSAAEYRINAILAAPGTVYSTSPSPTLPSVRVRMFLAANSQPPPQDLLGNMNNQTPPLQGLTQFVTQATYTLASGSNNVRLLRVGNYIRNLIFVVRNSSNARIGISNWPDNFQLIQDGFILDNVTQDMWQDWIYKLYGLQIGTLDGAGNQDTGVFPYPFTDGDWNGNPGNESRHRWLPTLESTRLQVVGTFGSTATQLTVVTNDISTAGDPFSNFLG